MLIVLELRHLTWLCFYANIKIRYLDKQILGVVMAWYYWTLAWTLFCAMAAAIQMMNDKRSLKISQHVWLYGSRFMTWLVVVPIITAVALICAPFFFIVYLMMYGGMTRQEIREHKELARSYG
ncbi:MAG TPA: hypothetical protein VFG56_02770 [Candidatus Saccharimonadales bacterium]|nr:hypothetical protein [Candidatus Saccharimonadales bacterium]